MKKSIIPIWIFLIIIILPACQDSDAGQEADVTTAEEGEAQAPDAEELAAEARRRLENAPLLEGGVAEQVKAIIEQGGQVYGKTATFEYLSFESGASVVDEGDTAGREIDELAMVLNANPRMNAEIVAYADHSGSMASAESLAKMRAMFIKSGLLDNGVEPQMVSTQGMAAEQSGDGSNKENNRVVVRLLGE